MGGRWELATGEKEEGESERKEGERKVREGVGDVVPWVGV